jgi:RES domain
MTAEIWFRHADRRVPFLWESSEQPAARWHRAGRGPVQYASDTPEGAWAEFLRHEGITEAVDLAAISRSLWALDVELDQEVLDCPSLPATTLIGGLSSYPDCQAEAERLRDAGATALIAPAAAALLPGAAGGEVVSSGELRAAEPARDGRTLCLFGVRPALAGHRCVEAGQPPERVLALTRHFDE